jgi:hypothetical protein
MYHTLLREAVEQVLAQDHGEWEQQNAAARTKLGALFDRILLLIQFAYHQCYPVHNDRFLLHAVSNLTRIPGPCLPGPLQRLLFHLHKSRGLSANIRDTHGRLALHCAVMSSSMSGVSYYDPLAITSRPRYVQNYMDWFDCLLQENPTAVTVADNSLRLPLHHALNVTKICCKDRVVALEANIGKLLDAYPCSLERRDPVTGLYPFMQAAANPNLSLDVVFDLLKASPTLVRGHLE